MDKNYNQSQMSVDIVRQLNQGLFQIQTELDNIKVQLQYERRSNSCEKKYEQANLEKEEFSQERSTLLSISNRIEFLSNEIKDLKTLNTCEVTSVVKSVKEEVTSCFEKMTQTVESFDKMLCDVKKSIVEKVEADFSSIVGKEFFGEEGRLDKLASDVAEGVEKKLELKFTEMFLELNSLIKNSENAETQMKNSEQRRVSHAVGEKIIEKLDILTLRMNAFEKLLDRSTESTLLEGKVVTDDSELSSKIDRLSNILEKTIQNQTEDSKNGVEFNDVNFVEFAEIKLRINDVINLINSKKEIELRPMYEVMNELDEKLADVKFGVNETMSKLASIDSGKFYAKTENSERLLLEVPKLIKEAIANGLSNVNDEETKRFFEKLNNLIATQYIKGEERYDELVKKINDLSAKIEEEDSDEKSFLGNYKDDEMEATLSSLRGELTNLSKLIKDAEFDKDVDSDTAEDVIGVIPKAITDATDELDDLTKEIFTDIRGE